jgi:hypothetical protein
VEKEKLLGLGRGHGDRGCGAGGEDGGLGTAFQELLFAEAIEPGLVTDVSRHGELLSVLLICVRTDM